MMRTIFIVASAIACAFVPMQIAANSSVEYASELSMAEKAENGAYPEHSIADVKSNLQAWDGKMVIVSGWIASDCNKLTCHLVDKIAAVHADDEAVHELSIAGTELDSELFGNKGQEVKMLVRISGNCAQSNVICTDRANEITPVKIMEAS